MIYRPDCYTLHEAAEFLGISYDAVRMRIKRGHFPAIRYGAKQLLIPSRTFWDYCARLEADGLIRLEDMPMIYRDERLLFIGAATFDHNILYGKKGRPAT